MNRAGIFHKRSVGGRYSVSVELRVEWRCWKVIESWIEPWMQFSQAARDTVWIKFNFIESWPFGKKRNLLDHCSLPQLFK